MGYVSTSTVYFGQHADCSERQAAVAARQQINVLLRTRAAHKNKWNRYSFTTTAMVWNKPLKLLFAYDKPQWRSLLYRIYTYIGNKIRLIVPNCRLLFFFSRSSSKNRFVLRFWENLSYTLTLNTYSFTAHNYWLEATHTYAHTHTHGYSPLVDSSFIPPISFWFLSFCPCFSSSPFPPKASC